MVQRVMTAGSALFSRRPFHFQNAVFLGVCIMPLLHMSANQTTPPPLPAFANPTNPPKREPPNIEKKSRTAKPTTTQAYTRAEPKQLHPLMISGKTASKNNAVQTVIKRPHFGNTSQWPQK
jgi:hypothetical protein